MTAHKTRTLTLTTILTVALLGAAAPGVMAAPQASVPPSGRLAFDVIRNGRDIGDYVVSFRGKGNDLTVNVATDVSVKVPVIGVSAYRFKQDSTETWRGGRLAGLTSRTDDNGKPHHISVGTTSLIPASLWNADLVRSEQVLNTIDGSTDAIRVRNLGPRPSRPARARCALITTRCAEGWSATCGMKAQSWSTSASPPRTGRR